MADTNPPPIPINLGEVNISEPIDIPPTPIEDFSRLNEKSAYEYVIGTIGIVNSFGRTKEIISLVGALNIYQDIYSGVVSGNAVILDNIDIIYELEMCGNEFIGIEYYHKLQPDIKFVKVFRIYKISDRTQLGNSGQSYILHFCSDFQLVSDTINLSKAYVGMKNSEIVEDILKEYLKIPADRYKVEQTDDAFDHIISNMRPIQAINWLASKSYSKGNQSYCYFFYESINLLEDSITSMFNFKSLKSMYDDDSGVTLDIASSKLTLLPLDQQLTISKFEVMDEFDILRSTSIGAFASKMTGIDIFNQKTNVYETSLEGEENNLLNKNLPINKLKERNDLSLLESYDALNLFYHEVKDNPTAKDNNVELILNRARSLAILNNFRIKVVVPGNLFLNIGTTIHVRFPAFTAINASDGKKIYNKYRGSDEVEGKFLITSIRHTYKGELFETVLELCSDSLASKLPEAADIVDDEF